MDFEHKKKKISSPIIFFSLYIVLMLFQVGSMGTLAAFGTMALTIFACFSSKRAFLQAFYMPKYSWIILIFLLTVSVTTFWKWGLASNYYKFVGQIVLFIFLATVTVDEYEHEYLKTVFIVASVFYAVLAVRYCVLNGASRYYHGRIYILGAGFDSNFLGIPFVIALTFLLNNILRNKRRWISFAAYLVITIAVIYTASRGNMLSWVFSSILTIIFFILDQRVKLGKKWFWLIIIFLLALFLVNYVSTNFVHQWTRMTEIGENFDNGRLALWNRAIVAWEESPIFGKGLLGMYNLYGKVTHNTYLEILSETGIIGALLMLLFCISLSIKAFQYDKSIFIAFLGMLLQIAFLDALDNRVVWIMFCWIAMRFAKWEEKDDELCEKNY